MRPKTPDHIRDKVIVLLRKQKAIRLLKYRAAYRHEYVTEVRLGRQLASFNNERIAEMCGVSKFVVSNIKSGCAELQRPL